MPIQVFVSYARNDDAAPLGGGKGFVSTLISAVQRVFLNCGPPRPLVWRDTGALRKSQQFEPRLQEQIERSDLLLVVLSNNWLASEWCRKELELFEQRWRHEGDRALKERIIVVAKQHLAFEERPELLQGQDSYKFYYDAPVRRYEEFFSPRGKLADEFYDVAAELGRELWQQGREIEAAGKSKTFAVYVAKPAYDMKGAYAYVTRELQHRGLTVLPAPDARIPDDSDATRFIDETLSRASLSVHLLGTEVGFTPEGVQQPIVKLQLMRAAKRAMEPATSTQPAFRRLIWSPERPLAAVKSLERALPNDAVIAGDMSRILSEIERSLPLTEPHVAQAKTFFSNLPEEVSTFIGRKSELKVIKRLLLEKRLVTVLGPAGVGKTRLALRVANETRHAFPGGVWFVELNALTGGDIAVAVANAMDLPLAGRDPLQAILQHIGSDDTLIVLDNSENVVSDCAKFADTLLRSSSALHLLITSRELLHARGEQVFELSPFPVPSRTMALEELRKCESVKLLVDRAASCCTSFRLSEANCLDIVRICEQLDGIPLAIEIAAARLGMFSAAEVASRLSAQFALVAEGTQGRDSHHTLRATIEWSYNLLNDTERRLFARLSILRGTYSLDAVEQICGMQPLTSQALFEPLAALVEKSFVAVVSTGSSKRFRMLHIIRSYAEERLKASGEFEALAECHFAYHRRLIEILGNSSSAAQPQALDSVEQAHPDIMGALRWAVEHAHPDLTKIALNLFAFWAIRGYLIEGATQLEAIAAADSVDISSRSRLLVRASGLRNAVGDYESAEADAQEAVRISETGNEEGLPEALHALAGILCNCGAYPRALELYERVLALEERRVNTVGMIHCLINAGIAHTGSGAYEKARVSIERAIPLADEQHQLDLLAWAFGALGNLEHHSQNLDAARQNYQKCLEISRGLGYKRGITQALNHLSQVSLLQNRPEDAKALIAESLAVAWEHDLSHQLADALEVVATLLVMFNEDQAAARIFGAIDALRLRMRFPFTAMEKDARTHVLQSLVNRHGEAWLNRMCDEGRVQPLQTILRAAKSSLEHVRVERRHAGVGV